jgi:hypothetical protein
VPSIASTANGSFYHSPRNSNHSLSVGQRTKEPKYDFKKNLVSILWKDKNVNMGLEKKINVGNICK